MSLQTGFRLNLCHVSIAVVLAVVGAASSAAREIAVAPQSDGTAVIVPAIAAAQPGDTIRLAKGLYHETIKITSGITLVGEAGAILDPSAPLRMTWMAASEVGPGVFRAEVKEQPRTLFFNGKIIAEIDEKRTGDNEGDWSWKKLLASGPPLSGFKFIRAIWIYRSDEKAVYAHFENGADPATLNLSAVWSRDAIITISGATNASVSGLTLAHGYAGISIVGKSRGCEVKNCTIGPWDKTGVLLTDGASACLLESNEISRGASEDWVPRDTSKERYEVWQIHKKAGFYDRVGINLLRAGAGNRIHANHVFETFDGIDIGDSSAESLDKPLPDPDHGRDTEIWDNVIERTRDSGIELGVGCINVKVHHNLLRQTHGGLRYKLPRIGPVFIYRNVLLDGAPFNIWYSMDDSPAEGYVYHNTVIGGQVGLMYSSFQGSHNVGAPRWHYLNNLVVARDGFFTRQRSVNAPVNFTADYNLVVGGGKPWPDDPAKDSHSLYVTDAKLTHDDPPRPAPDSPAIDAGLDLSTYFHGGPLPGCEPGYFKGKAPDIGAQEIR